MSLFDALAADVDAELLEVFGDDAQIERDGHNPAPLRGYFVAEQTDLPGATESYSTPVPTFAIPNADRPAGDLVGAVVRVRGGVYRVVRAPMDRHDGLTRLELGHAS